LFKQPSFTKETARASHNIRKYSNLKIKDALKFEFIDIEKSIKDTVQHYPIRAKIAKN
jgi:hypothetical protein